MDTKYTTIRISIRTQKKLMALGKKGDTYEEIIARLLNKIKPRKKNGS